MTLMLLFTWPAWGQLRASVDGRPRERWQQQSGRSAELRGIVSAGGRPVAGAIIRLQDSRMGMVVASTQTSTDGSFNLEGIDPGTYVLTVNYGVQGIQDSITITPLQPEIEVRFPGASPPGGSPSISASQLGVPQKAKNVLQDARRALAGNNLEKARKKLAQALQIEPRFPQALTLRAALHLSSGDTKSALDDLDNAIRIDPNYPDAYFMMGATLNGVQRFQDAERSVKQGLRLNPTAWQGCFELAKALLGEGQPGAALHELDAATKSAPPDFAAIHLVRGAALLRMQRYSEGAAEYATYLKLEPDAQDASQVKQALAQIQQKLAEALGGAE